MLTISWIILLVFVWLLTQSYSMQWTSAASLRSRSTLSKINRKCIRMFIKWSSFNSTFLSCVDLWLLLCKALGRGVNLGPALLLTFIRFNLDSIHSHVCTKQHFSFSGILSSNHFKPLSNTQSWLCPSCPCDSIQSLDQPDTRHVLDRR